MGYKLGWVDISGKLANMKTLPTKKWKKLRGFLRQDRRVYVGNEVTCCRFALLWISRSGGQWRLLPREYGDFERIIVHFAR